MKLIFSIILISLFSITLIAQNKGNTVKSGELFALPITDYVVDVKDTIKMVQVILPEGMSIPEKQLGLLRSSYSNNKDTSKVGWGRCLLIKGNYYYFGIHLYNKGRSPQKGDLLYTFFNYPAPYKGRIFHLIRQSVYIQDIKGKDFYDFISALKIDEIAENKMISALADDVIFTGKSMKEQNDAQDQIIKGGIFDGQKLFGAMQKANETHVKKFIDYIVARPQRYAGNKWKFSELFATWMVNETPCVVE